MKKVYSSWACTDDQEMKYSSNRKFYEENKTKIKFKKIGSGYSHVKFKLLENNENLSNDEVACIMDEGNLCFGYRIENGLYLIYTD